MIVVAPKYHFVSLVPSANWLTEIDRPWNAAGRGKSLTIHAARCDLWCALEQRALSGFDNRAEVRASNPLGRSIAAKR